MKLTNVCHFNGLTYTMNLNCTEEQLRTGAIAYSRGALLQDAFSFLNAGEREFLKTGTPPHVWDEMFGGSDSEAEAEAAAEQASLEARDRAFSDANERAYGGTID